MKHHEVPEILIEQYALGELSPQKAREIEQSLGFAERIAEIERSNAEILAQYPPELFAARIQNQFAAGEAREPDRAPRSSRRQPVVRWLTVALPGAAVVVAGVFLAVQGFVGFGFGGNTSDMDDIVRLKGSVPELSVYRSIEGPETRAYAGDRLQLAYNAGDREYGAIISVDGRGGVYPHFPLEFSSEPRLEIGGNQRLPYAYQLDDAPRFEQFYFITSHETFSVQQLLQTVRLQADMITERADSLELGDLLGDNFEIISVTIQKGE